MKPHVKARDREFDGSRIREYKLPPVAYFPVESPIPSQQPAQHRPQIDPALWPEIAERARHASLRALAAAYGVSHETIRTIRRCEARKQVPEAARARLVPSSGCASPAGDSSRQLAAGSS